jgi:hypothetical protein
MLRQVTTRSIQFLAIVGLVAGTTGCLQEAPSGPAPDPSGAPALPRAERLNFDFDFFQEPTTPERASRDNFFNAYIRAAVANAITHLVVVPPVAAFSVALHTVPSPQDDGSYLWIYTWVDGVEEVQIWLRGTPLGNRRAAWEMRVTSTIDDLDNDLWFEGETWNEGDGGLWRFHDPERDGQHVASLTWDSDAEGDYLRFVDEHDNVGDSLEYRENGPLHSFTFTDADLPDASWYVKWNVVDGTGSLRAPDYNGGEPACWDEYQRDTECGVS